MMALKQEILDKLPIGAQRIQVKTLDGELKYKALDDILDTDEVQVKLDGTPLVMMAIPGRKPKGYAATAPTSTYVGEIAKRRNLAISQDPLCSIVKSEPESAQTFAHLMQILSEEIAILGFERKEKERLGKESHQISTRRAGIISTTAQLWIKRKEQIASAEVDITSPGFKAYLRFTLETLSKAMQDCLMPDEAIQTVFSAFNKITSDPAWVNEAKTRMQNAVM